jgi:hypothetical protein
MYFQNVFASSVGNKIRYTVRKVTRQEQCWRVRRCRMSATMTWRMEFQKAEI